MDDLDKIAIRFHFGGSFQSVSGHSWYVGGDIAESWIDVDKLSYFEIRGHLEDHFRTDSILRLYWTKPGFTRSNGLVMLVNDASCQLMLEQHRGGLMVDMYAEEVGMEMIADDQDIWTGEDEADDDQVPFLEAIGAEAAVNCDSSKVDVNCEDQPDNAWGDDKVTDEDSDDDDSVDSDYVQPQDEDSSADDEEAA
jgi:hypothetical protein